MCPRVISALASAAASRWPWSPAGVNGMASRSGPGTTGARSQGGSARRCSTIRRGGGAMAELPWSSATLDLRRAAPVRQVGLQLRLPFPAYLAGLPLPLAVNRVAAMAALRVLWLGPDEWLIVADGDAPDLLPRLERAVAGRRAAVSDLSSSRMIIE